MSSPYAVTFARAARKELEAIRPPRLARVFAAIQALGVDPRPSGCKKLRGSSDLWRVRIGDYRIIYTIDDDVQRVGIVIVGHRSDVYR